MTIKRFKYESDLDLIGEAGTSIYAILRANSLTPGLTVASVANEEPTTEANTNIPVRITSTKKYGIIARHIVLQRLTTTTTSPNIQRVRIPILTPSVFIQYISQVGGSISYNGLEDWKIVGAKNEGVHLFFGT
jgi:hypothetical protein